MNIKREIKQYSGILAGSIIFGIAYSWFLVPYRMVPGGVGGISQIINHFFGISVGLSIVLLNIPLFIISIIVFGKRFGVRSFIGMMLSSVMVDVFNINNLVKLGFLPNTENYKFMHEGREILAMLPPEQIYLSAIAGAVLLGLGLGTIFRFRGSTAGTDIPVALIKKQTGVSIGTGYWVVESFIILTVGIVFKDLTLVIWGYINLFITSKMTDIAGEGMPYVKGAYIISPQNEQIKEKIFEKINRGVTFFKARGGYKNEEITVLFCAVNRRQVALLRDIVKDIDPKAFMILNDVYDVMGYGFKSRNLDLSSDKD
ncbi:MAG: membrane protein [Candidatus Cloacimonadota bacterium]|nr:MAG: membrane protein [Candidatus Cloacimonadota bacterium]